MIAVQVKVAPLALEVEQYHLTGLLGAAAAIAAPLRTAAGRQTRWVLVGERSSWQGLGWQLCRGGAARRRGRAPGMERLTGRLPVQPSKEMKLYIERLCVSRMAVTVSFLPTQWSKVQAVTGQMGAAPASSGLPQPDHAD